MKNILDKIVLMIAVLLFIAACNNPEIELTKPESETSPYKESTLVNIESPDSQMTKVENNGVIKFMLTLKKKVKNDEIVELSKSNLNRLSDEYNELKGGDEYTLLPNNYYKIPEKTIVKGENSTTIEVIIENYDNLTPNKYVLPLVIEVAGETLTHMIIIPKDIDYIALSSSNKKPMPPIEYGCSNRTEPMKMVAYVEANDWDIRNMGQFLLKDSKKPIFDFVVIFAANMNYDKKTGKRVLFFNNRIQKIVKDPERYIKPLKDRGIKVLINILPNHQGVGYENFQNYEEALDFAMQCKEYADKLGIDGWDIDEEYAKYNLLPEVPRVGAQSYLWFMRAMKEVMPDKLLTLYDYSNYAIRKSVSPTDEFGKTAVDYLDYSWANYDEDHNSLVGLPDEKYGRLSIEASRGGLFSFEVSYSAESNLINCNGLFMVFNIGGPDMKSGKAASVLSTATQLFYGEDCEFIEPYFKGPKDN